MPLELFTNAENPTKARATTLGAAMLAGATSLTVASSTGFPAAVAGVSQFRVLIESELFLVTNVAGLTWTVIGAQEGTTAAAHALSVAVSATITAGALANTGATTLVSPLIGGVRFPIYPQGFRANSNIVRNTGAIVYQPVQVTGRMSIQQLGIEVVTAGAAASTALLGVYAAAADLSVLALVASGTVLVDTTGVKTVTGLTTVLTPGVYLTALSPSAAVTLRFASGTLATYAGSTLTLNGLGELGSPYTYNGTLPANPAAALTMNNTDQTYAHVVLTTLPA